MNVKDTNCERAKAHGGNRGGKSPSMFETRCYDRVLGCEQQNQSSALFRDAELVDSPNEAKTFWLPADACPTTSLELLAKAIFDFHAEDRRQQPPRLAPGKSNTRLDGTAASDSHPSCAERGAEWWVQRREEGHHANLGMPFHWDKDERMLDQKGEVLCPAVSTVTYLTDHGAPTVVLESRVSTRGAVEHGDIKRAFVSYPALFKHLAFDGGFLHGVPEELMRTDDKAEVDGPPNDQPEESSTKNQIRSCATASPSAGSGWRKRGRMRVTLLVNVWLSHKPEGVAPLPADLAATLSNRGAGSSPLPCFDRPVDFFPVSIGKENEALVPRETDGVSVAEVEGSTIVINAPLGPAISLELRAPRPESLSVGRWRALHSFALSCAEGWLARISTGYGGKAGELARVDCSTIDEGSIDNDRAERRAGLVVERDVGREEDKVAERISRKRKA